MTLWLHLKADKVSHPCRQQGYPGYMEVHICQAHLLYRLRILRLPCLRNASSRCGEVEVVFLERRIASLLIGSSNSFFIRSSRRRIVQWACSSGTRATGNFNDFCFCSAIDFAAGIIGIDVSDDF